MQELKNKYYKLFENELFSSCIPFWLKYGKDSVNGGVKNCLDRTGKVYSTDKSVWMQGRTAYTFSHLCNQFGKNSEYLDFAKSCIDAEYYMATGDAEKLKEACKYYEFVYNMYHDPSTDPYHITPKTIAETRNMISLARPMILLNVTSIMRKADPANFEKYEERSKALIADIRKFYKPELNALLESVTADGEYLSDVSEGRIVNPGHCIEASWFLIEEGLAHNDKELIDFAATLFDISIERGWDREFGGILYFKDVENKPVEAYEHDMKLWWPHNEAVIASLYLYKITGEKRYKEWFEKITEYAFSHFSDFEYGEWFGYLRRDGKPTEPPCKGHTYKGAFHVIRMLCKVLEIFDK